MRIRKNSSHLQAYLSSELTAPQSVICVLSQNPWNVLSSSALSESLQIIEADDRFFRKGASQNSFQERKRRSTECAPSTEKVVNHPRVLLRKRQEASADCDDIYVYYTGYFPSRKKRRGAIQSCREAASRSNVGGKKDQDDDDEKPLKERSMKSLLAANIA